MRERTAGIVGREPEMDAVERLLTDAESSFAALLLEGEPGIGKTAIFDEALAAAEARGFRVVSCRTGPAEVALALAAISDLLDGFPAALWTVLPRPQRRALDVARLRIDPGDVPVNQRAVGAGLRSLLVALAAMQPVLLAIDDLQWLDAESATVLTFVLRRLAHERVALLATRRRPEAAALDGDVIDRVAPLAREQVGPLSLGAIRHILQERMDVSLPRSTLVRVNEVAHGNPLFAIEIARVLSEGGVVAAGAPLPVPDDVRALVRQRVAVLPDATRDLLLASSLLTAPDVETLERVLGRGAEADLAPAEAAGVARCEERAVVFTHPLHAAAVAALADAEERRRMHHRLAEVVVEPEERARHLALGSSAPDEGIANLVEEGAAAARGRGALHAAAELLELASSLTPGAEPARTRRIRAAELHLHSGDGARARSLLEEVIVHPLSPADRADSLRLLAEVAFAEEDLAESERLLVESLATEDDAHRAARTRLNLAYVLDTHRFDFVGAADLAQGALEDLRDSTDRALVSEALAYSAITNYLAGRGVHLDRIEQALSLEDPNRIPSMGLAPAAVAGLLFASVGRHAEARALLTDVRDRLVERGEERDLAHVLHWLSWLETRCGRFLEAERHADDAIACAVQTDNASFQRFTLVQRAYVHAHRGEVVEARQRCAESAPTEGGSIAHVAPWLAATGAMLELSLRAPEAAWEACRPLVEVLEQVGLVEPVPAFFLPDAIEALIETGDLARAERLVDLLEGRGRALDRTWALATGGRCRGLLLAARGDHAGSRVAFTGALSQHERIDLPFDRARTLLAKGATERRARRRAEARCSLEEAWSEFERMGAPLWAAWARDEVDRLGGRRPGVEGGLTPSERRVVELAVNGFSNKEIAAKLVVSVHTVEVHLSHAYDKLGVRSRSQLGARLAGVE